MRRGSLDLSLGEIIKLILGAAMLLLLFWMGYQLVQLFVSGEEHYRAERNFDLLIDRIETVQKEVLKYPENSVILDMPDNYFIIGFSAGQREITSRNLSGFEYLQRTVTNFIAVIKIPRPGSCDDDKACLCIAQATDIERLKTATTSGMTFDIIKCKDLKGSVLPLPGSQLSTLKTATGTEESINVKVWGPDLKFDVHTQPGTPFRSAYDLFINTEDGPRNVYITINGDHLLLNDTLASP